MSGAACAEEEETGTRSQMIVTLNNGLTTKMEILQNDEDPMSLGERKMLNDKLKHVANLLSEAYDSL